MAKRGNSEGSIYKRADGRWCAAVSLGYVGGKLKRKAIYGKTRAEVQEKLARSLVAKQQGVPAANDRIRVSEFLRRWLDQTAANVRPSTLDSYRFIVEKHIIPELGAIPLGKLTPELVQQFVNASLKKAKTPRSKSEAAAPPEGKRATLSPRTVELTLAVLRKSLQQAVRWNLVARNVASKEFVDGPRVERAKIRPFDPEEARRLVVAARGDRLEALYVAALSLGLREGEVLGLQWSDLNFDARTLRVTHTLQRRGKAWSLTPPKTEKSRRTIKLPPTVADSLRKHRARQLEERLAAGEMWQPWADADLVFTTETGAPLHPKTLLTRYHALLAKAELPRRRFHDTRHSAASLLLAQGVPAKTIQETLGHSEIRTTLDLYSHLFADAYEHAANAMESALFGATKN